MINIYEYIIEKLENTKLFEIAYSRSKYMDIVNDIAPQIIENWCLIRYSSLNSKLQEHNHWIKELKAHIMKLQRSNIKTDKTRATRSVFMDWMECNKSHQIKKCIEIKWEDEGFDINSDISEEVISDFVSYGIHEIIEIICNDRMNLQDLNNYLNNI